MAVIKTKRRKSNIDGISRRTNVNYRATPEEKQMLHKLADDYNCSISRIIEKAFRDMFKKERML